MARLGSFSTLDLSNDASAYLSTCLSVRIFIVSVFLVGLPRGLLGSGTASRDMLMLAFRFAFLGLSRDMASVRIGSLCLFWESLHDSRKQ